MYVTCLPGNVPYSFYLKASKFGVITRCPTNVSIFLIYMKIRKCLLKFYQALKKTSMNRKKGTEYFELNLLYILFFIFVSYLYLLSYICVIFECVSVDTALSYFLFNCRNSSLTDFNRFATNSEMYFGPFNYLKCLKVVIYIYTHPGNYFMGN